MSTLPRLAGRRGSTVRDLGLQHQWHSPEDSYKVEYHARPRPYATAQESQAGPRILLARYEGTSRAGLQLAMQMDGLHAEAEDVQPYLRLTKRSKL